MPGLVGRTGNKASLVGRSKLAIGTASTGRSGWTIGPDRWSGHGEGLEKGADLSGAGTRYPDLAPETDQLGTGGGGARVTRRRMQTFWMCWQRLGTRRIGPGTAAAMNGTAGNFTDLECFAGPNGVAGSNRRAERNRLANLDGSTGRNGLASLNCLAGPSSAASNNFTCPGSGARPDGSTGSDGAARPETLTGSGGSARPGSGAVCSAARAEWRR